MFLLIIDHVQITTRLGSDKIWWPEPDLESSHSGPILNEFGSLMIRIFGSGLIESCLMGIQTGQNITINYGRRILMSNWYRLPVFKIQRFVVS